MVGPKKQAFCPKINMLQGNFDTNFISENYSEWKLEDIPMEAIAAALLSSKNSSVVTSSDTKSISSPWSQKGHWRHGL